MMKQYNRNDLFIASVRFFDVNRGGLEKSDDLSYVVVQRKKVNNSYEYCNVFNEKEKLPVFKRTPYSNYDENYEPYGCKIVNLSNGGWLESGQCWVFKQEIEKCFPDTISLDVIEDLVLDSGLYFKDRKKIALNKFKKGIRPVKMLRIISKDLKDESYMNYLISERDKDNANKRKIKKIKKL